MTENHDQKVITGEVVDTPVDPTQPEPASAEYEVIEKAGVVAFFESGKQIILTTTSADSNKWVLPKGHVEKKDISLQAAALREFTEETGFTAELFTPQPVSVIERWSQTTNDDDEEELVVERVTFFMGQVTGIVNDAERPVQLIEPSLAIRKLAYEDYAKVVLEAVQAREKFMTTKVVYLRMAQSEGVKVQ